MKINKLTVIFSSLLALFLPGQALAQSQATPQQTIPHHHQMSQDELYRYQESQGYYGHPNYQYGVEDFGNRHPVIVNGRHIKDLAVDRRTYERQVRESQPGYKIAPGVTFYPAPRAQHDYYGNRYIYHRGRVYDQCSNRDLRAAALAGIITGAHMGNGAQATGAMAGAAAGAYAAGRIAGGSCR